MAMATPSSRRLIVSLCLIIICVGNIWIARSGHKLLQLDINYVDVVSVAAAAVETNVATHDVEESINEKAASSDQPPEATQPLSHTKCCIPKAFQGIKNPKDTNCFGTCYSAERACNDPIYPFTSAEEKSQFPLNNLTKYPAKVRRKLIRQCLEPERMTPPVEWCQKPTNFGGGKEEGEKTTNGTIATAEAVGAPAQLVKNIPPAGCSLAVGHSSGSGAFQHGKVFLLCVRIGRDKTTTYSQAVFSLFHIDIQ